MSNKITYEERRAVYQAAIEKYGEKAQLTKAVEELGELIVEICHMRLGRGDREALADELADATIMCEQLRQIFDINDEVCDHMDYKVLRLSQRICRKDTGTDGKR